MKELGPVRTPWDEEFCYVLGLYKLIGHGIGVWPPNCHDFGSKLRFLTVIFLQLSLNYNVIREVVSDCEVFVIGTMSYIAASTIGTLKILAMRVQVEKMHFLVESAVEDWRNVRDDKSREIMRRYARIGTSVGIIQLGAAYATIFPTILSSPPTFEQFENDNLIATNLSGFTGRNLPLSTGCFVIDTPIYFYLLFYLLEAIQYIVSCTTYVGSDAIFFGVAMYLCGQIEILKNRIKILGRDLEGEDTRKIFNGLIRRHNHLACLADIVEDVFHLIILVQLAGSSLNICQTGFDMLVALKNDDYTAIIRSPVVISIICLQLFLYCYAGDYLGSQMEELRDATYDCYWYNFPQSLKKNAIIMMMRCKVSFYLTAGKMYRMNLMNFTTIVKTIVSFFSVVKLTVMD